MPNYKTFQDNADSLRVKIYGLDDSNNTVPVLTDASGKLDVTGTLGVSGSVAVSGPVEISGSVAVSGPVEISGSVAVSGTVAVSGPLQISGSVAVSGPVEISGSVAVSGTVGISGTVGLSGHSFVDSGPITDTINSGGAGESGAFGGGSYDVISYTSWTLAVKYSGASGDQVTVQLQTSALSGGAATNADYVFDSSGNFTNGSWLFFTAGITPRYARLYYKDTGAASGSLNVYFQAQN